MSNFNFVNFYHPNLKPPWDKKIISRHFSMKNQTKPLARMHIWVLLLWSTWIHILNKNFIPYESFFFFLRLVKSHLYSLKWCNKSGITYILEDSFQTNLTKFYTGCWLPETTLFLSSNLGCRYRKSRNSSCKFSSNVI